MIPSSFQRSCTVELISAQQMRKMAKKEPMYIVVVRTTNEDIANEARNEPRKQCTVSVNEDKTQTPYPEQVQAILTDFADVFLKDLPTGLPPQRKLDHRIELVPGAEPPHKAPYRMSP